MKRVLLILLAVLWMIGALVSCGNDGGEESFSTAVITEKAPQIIEPISEKLQTSYEICFLCGNLMEVTRNAKGQVVEENCTDLRFCYTYDENGRILQCELTDKDYFITQTLDVEYESETVAKILYDDNVVMTLTFDEKGNWLKKESTGEKTTLYYENQRVVKIEILGENLSEQNFYVYECQYENGFLKTVIAFACDENGAQEKLGEIFYSYNTEGRVEKILAFEINEGNSVLSGKQLYSYENDGSWSCTVYDRYNSYHDQDISLHEKLTYDANWYLLESIEYDGEGNADYVERYEYQLENGSSIVTVRRLDMLSGLTERENRYVNGDRCLEIGYTYDENNVLVNKTENEFKNGRHKRSTSYNYQYTIDGVGGYLRVTVHDVVSDETQLHFILVSDVIYDSNGNVYTPKEPEVMLPDPEEETTRYEEVTTEPLPLP